MPRDASGNMTLPATNPVVANTDITTTWANGTISDLAAEIEDSLSRSGKGGMLVPFQHSSGNASAPGVTFTAETTSGLYYSSSTVGMSILGNLKQLWAAALSTVKTAMKVEGALEVTGAMTLGGAFTAADGTIPRMTVAEANKVISGTDTGSFNTTSAAWTDVTHATVSITSHGRPLFVALIPDNSGTDSFIGVSVNGVATPTVVAASFRWVRSGTSAANVGYSLYSVTGAASVALGGRTGVGAVSFVDVPAAGTYTYQLQIKCAADTIGYCDYAKVFAYEL